MTAAEKQKIACFLDFAEAKLVSGYRTERVYQFTDDEAVPVQSAQTKPVTANSAGGQPSSGQNALLEIAEEIKACRNCPLGLTRKNAVPGEGAAQPVVMVIGEGPGADEDATGRPFVGRAGQLLDKMLSSINLSRNNNCFIANVIKCRAPGNRDPYPEETSACSYFLKRQISLLKPKFILIAGRIAAQTLLKTNEPMGKLRGKFTDMETGENKIPMIATYHPSALLRSEEYKRPAWEDLKLLRSRIESSGGTPAGGN